MISPDWWNLSRTSSCRKLTVAPVSTTTMEETSPKVEKMAQRSSMLAWPVTNRRVVMEVSQLLLLASLDWGSGNILLSTELAMTAVLKLTFSEKVNI